MLGEIQLKHNDSFKIIPSITRGDKDKLIIPPVKSNIKHYSFFLRTARFYSTLPANLRNSNLYSFTNALNKVSINQF